MHWNPWKVLWFTALAIAIGGLGADPLAAQTQQQERS
jgi:hypothetical protein